ncbi:MAG: Major facilitator superfamily [Candidatus Roizmanbacteria bacterium GW2011_GWA2_36_23]|uniref:Major facilitator superfamily n=1 Tax=Candidatus Roizmanbacteria bacterium GW2011_GWA2_36_23 TaxID=1618480 RepID=A0A0G0ELT0_9BACT|nr:MAG: Major facilitator superfamily [Candidatus Roizmanbacteria bacterium GW2011_GWA2_36_23]
MFRKWDNISKIALIYFFSSLYFYLPVLTIFYRQKGLSFLQIGSLWGILTFAIFLSEIPTGMIADKYGRKASIILAMLFQLIGEIMFLFANNYIHFILINIIAGIGFAFQSGCIQALVYDFLKDKKKEDKMKKIWGDITAFGQAGFIIGATTSSFIVTSKNTSQIIFSIILTIISVSIALSLTLMLEEPKTKYQHSEQSPVDILKISFNLIKSNPILRRIILFGLFTTPFLAFLNAFQPPYFELSKIPLSLLGISRAIAGILAIIFLKNAYKLEEKFKENGILIATLIPAIFYLLMSFIFSPIIGVALFILNYSTMRIQEPLLADYYNVHLQSNVRATSLSAINMFSSIYIAIMGLITGKLADVSLPLTFIVIGIIIIFGTFVFRIDKKVTA